MTTSKHTMYVDVCGDRIEIEWDGNVWVAPSCGAQFARASEAMEIELRQYMRDCGEDVDDAEVAEQIAGYLSQMADADD